MPELNKPAYWCNFKLEPEINDGLNRLRDLAGERKLINFRNRRALKTDIIHAILDQFIARPEAQQILQLTDAMNDMRQRKQREKQS